MDTVSEAPALAISAGGWSQGLVPGCVPGKCRAVHVPCHPQAAYSRLVCQPGGIFAAQRVSSGIAAGRGDQLWGLGTCAQVPGTPSHLPTTCIRGLDLHDA